MSNRTSPCVAAKKSQNVENPPRISDLQANQDLWYKIHVLLYDLCNIANDRTAEARTLATTDELYISAPYFTAFEASLIKTTLVLPLALDEIPEFEMLGYEGKDAEPSQTQPEISVVSPESVMVEEAIKTCLCNFFVKRRASGDARPCGPHDMGPIYLAVFGIAKQELKDEKFLSRLRRAGLPQLGVDANAEPGGRRKAKKREKNGGKR